MVGIILRKPSFHAIEALVRSPARKALGILSSFGNDTLVYFSERLAVEPLQAALVSVLRQAKRNKAFEASRLIGLALATASRRPASGSCAEPSSAWAGAMPTMWWPMASMLRLPFCTWPMSCDSRWWFD